MMFDALCFVIIIFKLVIINTSLVFFYFVAESEGVRSLIKDSEIQRMMVRVDSAIDADKVSTYWQLVHCINEYQLYIGVSKMGESEIWYFE